MSQPSHHSPHSHSRHLAHPPVAGGQAGGPCEGTVRTFEERDQVAVAQLFGEGLLVGQVDPDDPGDDVQHIPASYLQDQANGFWVFDTGLEIVGMVGVTHNQKHIAAVRRLRVAKKWQHADVADRLLEAALKHCRHFGYLKVVLDTRMEHNEAVDLFTRLGFQYTRARPHHGKEMLEFYLDLHHVPPAAQ